MGYERQQILDRLVACIGPKAYNRLVDSQDATRSKGRLRFWQEELFRRFASETGIAISSVEEFLRLFEGTERKSIPVPTLTKGDFFADPNRHYYLGGLPVPDGWIAEAWETIAEFRDNISYEFEREASKLGDLDGCRSHLEFLDRILPLHRMVELYERVRARSPHREQEFRPTFERVFGDRMSAFPEPLSPNEDEEPFERLKLGEKSDDGAIPF
jgi:hypothetical protein